MRQKYLFALKAVFAVIFVVYAIFLAFYILAYIGMLWFLFNVFITGS